MMSWKRRLAKIRGVVGQGARDAELNEEVRAHMEMEEQENRDSGMPAQEAHYAALRKFGNVARAEEESREAWTWSWLETLLQDVRYGARQLRRNPGFTLVAVFTLALGIGANTALFSVVNGVLLNPLPFPDPDRLVAVDASKPNFPRGSISYPNFLDWHRLNHCFSFFAVARATGFLLTGEGQAEELNAAAVTSDFFPLLGIKPTLGRNFTLQEDQVGLAHVVAISTDLWQRKFGASADVIGKEISMDGNGYTIVGVFPGHLDLPMRYAASVDVYIPLGEFANPLVNNRLAGLGIHGIARLKPGVTLAQARAEMQLVTSQLATIYPEADKDMGATLTPMKESMVGNVRSFLVILLGAVGFVLLIACVNVANILLARGNARSREIAVRCALGAGAGRLIRQMLTESVLLAMMGGGLGLALAAAGTRAALAALPANLPRATEVSIDARVLWFTLIISLGAGILFGLLPAIHSARPMAYETLKEGTRGSGGASRHRAQSALVMVQMALALILLAGAGLLIRSLSQLWKVHPGFDPNNIVTFNLALAPQMNRATPAAIRSSLRQFDASISAIPGVEAESLSWGAFPMYNEDDQNFWIAGQPRPASESQMYGMLDYIVGPDYLRAMRIPLLAGRFFTAADNEHSKPVVVVDEVLAKKYFPDGDAIGKVICQGDQTHTYFFEIVGVVGHVNQWGLDTDSRNSLRAQVYFPLMQLPDNVISLVPSNTGVVVRSAANVPGLIDSIRRASDRLNHDEVLTSFQTMHGIIQFSLAPRRFAMWLLGTFAALALVLAAIGLYGVVAYAVGQRTHEIGVRMALGAQKNVILRMVVTQGLRLVLAGVAIGILGALVLTRFLSGLLYDVRPADPLTLLVVSLILTAVALGACFAPAWRAARVDPMTALRCE